MTSIGGGAFNTCPKLKSIMIPDSVTSLGYALFGGDSELERIAFGSGITSILRSCFWVCSSCIIFDFRRSVSVPSLENVNAF